VVTISITAALATEKRNKQIKLL